MVMMMMCWRGRLLCHLHAQQTEGNMRWALRMMMMTMVMMIVLMMVMMMMMMMMMLKKMK